MHKTADDDTSIGKRQQRKEKSKRNMTTNILRIILTMKDHENEIRQILVNDKSSNFV